MKKQKTSLGLTYIVYENEQWIRLSTVVIRDMILIMLLGIAVFLLR